MLNILTKFIFLCVLSLSLNANNHTTSIVSSSLKSNTVQLENDNTIIIKNLSLETIQTELKQNSQAALIIQAAYSDDTIKYITKNIQWIIQNNSIVTINNTTLETLKEGTTTIQAKIDNTTSNKLKITVYKDINGYKLPPEPNKEENDKTLLGIDTNNNIVRDDVERWIYEAYDNPVEIGLFMQSARRLQLQIEDPSKAHETVKYTDNSLACEYYLENTNKEFKKKYEYQIASKELKKIQFNTIQRHMAYQRYNAEFHGEVFKGSIKASKEKCEFDENGVLGELK